MKEKKSLIKTIPVLPSSNMKRDITWYKENVGFDFIAGDEMYSILRREEMDIHLQWHADIPEDPLLGGSVVRFWVKDVKSLFDVLLKKGILAKDKLRLNTDWGTNEFGLYDPNNNALIFFEDISPD